MQAFFFYNVLTVIPYHWHDMRFLMSIWGRRGRGRMVVRFTTTYAISAYHHWSCVFEFHAGEVYSIQHYVIKFVSARHDIAEILLKVALNTMTLTLSWSCIIYWYVKRFIFYSLILTSFSLNMSILEKPHYCMFALNVWSAT